MYWDYKTATIVHFKPWPCVSHPAWLVIDCGCSNGLEWGGESPRECNRCGGGGVIYRHKKSGALAQYPGGPFCGRDDGN